METALTITDLARLAGRPYYVIDYAVRVNGPQPFAKIAGVRVWRESDLPAVIASVDKTHANDQKFRPHRQAVAK